DNDADGRIDFPFEPGCTTDLDDSEVDPVPAPQCGNGVDDDADTIIDYPADPGCDSAADTGEIDECVAGVPVNSHPGGVVMGTTTGTSHLSAPAACGAFESDLAPESVYLFDNTRSLAKLSFSTAGTGFDTALYAR